MLIFYSFNCQMYLVFCVGMNPEELYLGLTQRQRQVKDTVTVSLNDGIDLTERQVTRQEPEKY